MPKKIVQDSWPFQKHNLLLHNDFTAPLKEENKIILEHLKGKLMRLRRRDGARKERILKGSKKDCSHCIEAVADPPKKFS